MNKLQNNDAHLDVTVEQLVSGVARRWKENMERVGPIVPERYSNAVEIAREIGYFGLQLGKSWNADEMRRRM